MIVSLVYDFFLNASAVMVLFAFLLLLVGLVGAIYLYLIWPYDHWKRLGMPGPKPQLFVGTYPNSVLGKENIIYDFDDTYNKFKKSYRAIGAFMARKPEILVLDPALAHEIMVTNFAKYRSNIATGWILDKNDKYAVRNPFFTDGDNWKMRRADVVPALTLNKLTTAYPIWKENGRKLSNFLDIKTRDKNHAILETKNLSYRYTVGILGDFLWGIDADTYNPDIETNIIMDMSKKMLEHNFKAVIRYYALALIPFLRKYLCIRVYPAETDNFFSQLTKDAIAMRLKDTAKKERTDFLNHAIQLQEKKDSSHDDMMGQLLTVLLDGYETSGGTIHNLLYYLAKYPEAQEKLRAEILAQPVDEDGFLNFDTLNALPYLDQCVHESIRLVSPIPMSSRVCTEPTSIEVTSGKFVNIAPGTILTVPLYSYHHDADVYPDPHKFKPERFDNGAHLELSKKGMLLAFGDGPRICAGMRMGMLEVKLFIVQVIRAYRVKSCAGTFEEKKPDSNSLILGFNGDILLDYERL